MWVKPLKAMVGDFGYIKRDIPVELNDTAAKELIDASLAVPLDGEAPASGGSRGRTPANPPKPRRSGGQTGAEKPSSVSAEGQAPKKRASKKSAKPAES